MARVRAVLRRSAGSAVGSPQVFRAGRVRIDPGRAAGLGGIYRRAQVRCRHSCETARTALSGPPSADSTPREIELTATEFDLLLILVRHPRRVFERSSLLSSVWGYPAAAGARTVDVHVAALRREAGRRQPDQDGARRRLLRGCPVTDQRATPARRPRTTLAVRVTLLVVAVAVLVAVIASVDGVLLVRRTLIEVTTQALADRADVITAQVTADPASAARFCDARRVTLLTEVPATSVLVSTDARRIRQVLDGLAENALRLLGPGRPLVLHLGIENWRRSVGCRRRWRLQSIRRPAGPRRWARAGAGGLPGGLRAGRLHERYRGRRPAGAGLGLALAQSLVARLGGTIVASPAAEGGVAMTIRLPLSEAGLRRSGRAPGSARWPVTVDLDALLASARVFAIPLVERFRGITVRGGSVAVRGPAGWAEFAPFRDYSDVECVPWLRVGRRVRDSAVAGTGFADRVEVNTTVPVVARRASGRIGAGIGLPDREGQGGRPAGRAGRGRRAGRRGAATCSVRAAGSGWTPTGHGPLTEAVDGDRDARPRGRWSGIRRAAVPDVARAGARSVGWSGRPSRRTNPSAGPTDPAKVALAGAADIAVIKVAPLGGVRAALRIAAAAGLPVVVSSAMDSSVGLAAGLALAAALPELPYRLRLGHCQPAAADV